MKISEKEFKLMILTGIEYRGFYIKFYRERLRMTQIKLAKMIKTSATELGLYEAGKKIPDREYLDRVYKGINKYVEENKIEIIR